ncbi:type II toxin-antitoxin system Phd/YefM family antitoxin [Mesorhizobium sp. IMUNJ 23232]|uniref:type II toxin-antitoxin system Phd/YefM family antitoxin n=1 Tax=Mesorhizobium sp. IMUNJ 23232 TaxID=3376064 RepID=UPI003795A39A
MPVVNMHEAKSSLSRLVEAVASGEEDEIVIARNGKPAAKLLPIEGSRKGGVRLGLAAGKYRSISLEEFNSTDDTIAAMFDGSEVEPSR